MKTILVCLLLAGCAAPLKREKVAIKYEFQPRAICMAAEKVQTC